MMQFLQKSSNFVYTAKYSRHMVPDSCLDSRLLLRIGLTFCLDFKLRIIIDLAQRTMTDDVQSFAF